MEGFFSDENVINAIRNCQMLLLRENAGNEFEEERNTHILNMLEKISEAPEHWDLTTKLNIKYFGAVFLKDLNSREFSKTHLDALFSSLFRFSIENYISTPYEMSQELRLTKEFAVNKNHLFHEIAIEQINYALKDMSISMFKSLYNQDELKSIRGFATLKQEAERIRKEWDEDLVEKEMKVSELKNALNAHQDGFNFVGLHAGFAKLGRSKAEELFWTRIVMITIGFIIPISILTQAFIFFHFKIPLEKPMDLIKVFPGASITLLLIYYFRVSLNSYSSVRAQIMQIELRKSLCRFIQRYSEYSEGISAKNPNLLTKFEDVIFSNIMTSEDKIPSSFDGIEQIANLVASLKGK